MDAVATPAPFAAVVAGGMDGLFPPAPAAGLALERLNHFARSRRLQGAPRPHVPPGTAREYARLVFEGVPNDVACAALGISLRTAEKYRKDLRDQAGPYIGREVTYEYCARYVIDEGFRARVDADLCRAEGATAAAV